MTPAIKNPHLLPLLLFALLPLLLHILDRRRARAVVWPAMRFLVPRDVRRARRLRRREALLILTRTLLAFLAAAAFLRPVTVEERQAAALGSSPRNLVMVIDVSYSMAHRPVEDGPSALERAREAALNELDGAAPGSRAAVILLSGGKEEHASRLGPLDDARRAARDAVLAGGPFRLLAALDRAAEVLIRSAAGAADAPAEIFVFTDLQKSSLVGLDSNHVRFLRERLRGPLKPRIRIVDCGAERPVNRFVSSFELEPLAASADQPLELRARIESTGEPLAAAPLPVHLLDQGGGGDALHLAPGADGAIAAVFARRVATPGDVRLTVQIPGDGLAADDSRSLVVEVLDRLPVLVVGDTTDPRSSRTTRYVDLALVPRARDATAPPLAFRPRAVSQITAGDLEDCRVVIVTALERLDDTTAVLLESFVRRGGGLLLFAGGPAGALPLTERLFRSGQGILPAQALPREPVRSEIEAHPRIVAQEHPVFAAFRGPESGDAGRVTVRAWTRLGEKAPGAEVLAALDDGSPWLIERRVDGGRVILATTSAAPDDSDLPLTPLFLPLLHRLTRYLAAPDSRERNLEIGDEIRWPLPAGVSPGEVTMLDPQGASRTAETIEAGGRKVAVFGSTGLPGFYELSATGPSGRVTAAFAVNVAEEESRLERSGPEAIEELRRSLGAEVVRDVEAAVETTVTVKAERERWPLLFALALAALLAEMWILRGFGRGPDRAGKVNQLTSPPGRP